MGFRYRKSINLGGGFRVNLSKSGIGYSWGTKGYRVTKKSRRRCKKNIFYTRNRFIMVRGQRKIQKT